MYDMVLVRFAVSSRHGVHMFDRCDAMARWFAQAGERKKFSAAMGFLHFPFVFFARSFLLHCYFVSAV